MVTACCSDGSWLRNGSYLPERVSYQPPVKGSILMRSLIGLADNPKLNQGIYSKLDRLGKIVQGKPQNKSSMWPVLVSGRALPGPFVRGSRERRAFEGMVYSRSTLRAALSRRPCSLTYTAPSYRAAPPRRVGPARAHSFRASLCRSTSGGSGLDGPYRSPTLRRLWLLRGPHTPCPPGSCERVGEQNPRLRPIRQFRSLGMIRFGRLAALVCPRRRTD